MKKVTIADVARAAGVSIGTVSAVINGKDTVKSGTRERVLTVIKEMNFRPEGKAQNLKNQGGEKCIAVVIKELDNPFYIDVAEGVKEYASPKGYLTLITSSENIHAQEERITAFLATRDISGAIIAPALDGKSEIEHLFNLKRINFPFVLLEEVSGINANVVRIDNFRVTQEVVSYLTNADYHHIIHFAGPPTAPHSFERIEGIRRAFSESHLVYSESLIVPVGDSVNQGYQKGLEYFSDTGNQRFPMAVISFNDQVALGLLSALQELNIEVPEQVAIIGNDNIEVARHSRVPLTTISPPKKLMGSRAAEILIRNIEATVAFPVENIVLDAEMIIRDSTSPKVIQD